jgi:N-acetylglucosamine kinase-like BadF-type ATPase
MDLALGVDAGGTRTRAVLVTTDGRVLARGFAGPGNPVTDPVAAAGSLSAAVGAALAESGRDGSEVRAVGLGVAGVSAFARPTVASLYASALSALGVTAPLMPIADVVTAFAAGTSSPSGAVLIAGTGAVAAVIRDGRVVRVADGLGWRLGDAGSGVWLGVQAVRATVKAWYAGSTSDLCDKLGAAVGMHDPDALVSWGNAAPREEFAALAPIVCATAEDPRSRDIITRAATELASTLDELGDFDGPVVLAGGLFAAPTPLRSAVLQTLSERGHAPLIGGDAAVAAARVALIAVP